MPCCDLRPVPNPDPFPFAAGRRSFLKTGIAGAAMLVLARTLSASTPATAASRPVIGRDARAMLASVIPVLLDGALPTGAEAADARAQTLAAVEEAIAGLPPASRDELAGLFSLLAFAPSRWIATGIWSSWSQATPDAIAAFLDRWRSSRFALLRSAYAALHQLVFAAWYAQPRAWPAIGYPGPPVLPGR
ncbi:MAG TPA: hypothetical protein VL742_10840 [Casimicrobiaceae bacterium]|nr:hypothetical protein [Casimicrobiaceae bacterium]